MWVLIQEQTGGGVIDGLESGQACWGLVPGFSYSVGRTPDCEIQSPGDTSISKQHARIVVSQIMNGGNQPEVILEDLGSKFGTHMNSGIMSEAQRVAMVGKVSRALSKPVKLKDNDRIRFGVMYSIFRLKWVVLGVTTSMVKNKSILEGWLNNIEKGTKLQSQWSNESTTHLAMNSISLSLKVVNALAKGVPIVLPEFFRDFLSSMESRQKLPMAANFTPSVSNTDSESQLRDPDISFKVNTDRKQVFKNKTFVFLNEKQHKDNMTTIKLAGGEAIIWSELGMPLSDLTRPGYCVIQPPGLNKNTNSQSLPSYWSQVSSHLTGVGFTSCPPTSIYLAIVHCNTAVHCNPQHKTAVSLPRQMKTEKNSLQVLVPDSDQADTIVLTDDHSNKKTEKAVVDSTSDTQITQVQTESVLKKRNRSPSPPAEQVAPPSKRQITEQISQPKFTEQIIQPKVTEKIIQPKITEQIIQPNRLISKIPITDNELINSLKQNKAPVPQQGTGALPLSERPMNTMTAEPMNTLTDNAINSMTEKPMNTMTEKPMNTMTEKPMNTMTDKTGKMNEVWNITYSPDILESEIDTSQSLTSSYGSRKRGPDNSPEPEKRQKKTRRMSSSKSRENNEDDLFGFEDSPKKQPSEREKGEELFDFSDSDDERAAVNYKKKIIRNTKVDVAELPDIPAVKKVNVEIPGSSKDMFLSGETDINSGKNVSKDVTGYIGKEDVTIKSEKEDEVSHLSRSLCRVITLSLLRPPSSSPRPVYVPNKAFLDKPTVNFKIFKKQSVVIREEKPKLLTRTDGEKKSQNLRVIDWIEQHHEVTRKEQLADESIRQSEDFWSFHNSQDARGAMRKKTKV